MSGNNIEQQENKEEQSLDAVISDIIGKFDPLQEGVGYNE